MQQKTHYPSFNVMNEKDAWDDHTQSILDERLATSPYYQFLNEREVSMLCIICGILTHDFSDEVLQYVMSHIDQTLYSSPGESQRKIGVPEGKRLVREGLQSLEKSAESNYATAFVLLNREDQEQLLRAVSESNVQPDTDWAGVPQIPFFDKLMSLTIESYCSHPKIWSEIGYAGPAYPRGYVRTQSGQLDPWEAKVEQ